MQQSHKIKAKKQRRMAVLGKVTGLTLGGRDSENEGLCRSVHLQFNV